MRRTRRRTLKGAHSTKLSNLLNLKTEKIHCETKWERLYAHCSRHTIHQIQSMQSPAVAYYPPIAIVRERWSWIYLCSVHTALHTYLLHRSTTGHSFSSSYLFAYTHHVDCMLCAFAISPSNPATFITRGQFRRAFNLKYLYELNAMIIFHLDNKWPNSIFIFSQ